MSLEHTAYFDQWICATRPTLKTWEELAQAAEKRGISALEAKQLRAALDATWPRELPRPTPRSWRSRTPQAACVNSESRNEAQRKLLLSLCCDFDEEATYPLYVEAAAADPRLLLQDGTPAVTLWRQPRGVVELLNGAKMKLGEPGMGDMGALILVEPKPRVLVQLYGEVEIKICGNIPPGAAEYRGTSKRKLTQTEQDQITRQRAMTSRGGFYCCAERTKEMCDALVTFREQVLRRLAA